MRYKKDDKLVRTSRQEKLLQSHHKVMYSTYSLVLSLSRFIKDSTNIKIHYYFNEKEPENKLSIDTVHKVRWLIVKNSTKYRTLVSMKW